MVKLARMANCSSTDLVQKRKEGFIAATLKVLEGAFRLTTEAAMKNRSTRDITVQFPTVTAGIRAPTSGQESWRQGSPGVIEADHSDPRGDRPVQMKDPLTYLQAPKQGLRPSKAFPWAN